MLTRTAAAAITAITAITATAPAAQAYADTVRDGQQWVLGMMDVAPAWQETQGQGVLVAVIDSGVIGTVSDLSGQVMQGPDLSGVFTSASNPNWGVHGTWMASLIAGHGHQPGGTPGAGDDGVIGIAPGARVLAIRVILDKGDPRYHAYEHQQEDKIQRLLSQGIDEAVADGAQVISMSIGYTAPSTVVRAALLNAQRHGVVVVASAGNSGSSTAGAGGGGEAPDSFPAEYPGVIGVGAVNASGNVAGFSSDNLSVQVAAPGVNVPAQGRDGQYWYVSGTSPACALVAGVAALIRSRYPRLRADLVARALTTTTTHRPASGYDSAVGFGIVDAAAALSAASRLAAQGDSLPKGIGPAGYFGGGPAANPAPPVAPRGDDQLILFSVLALTCLVLTFAAVSRLAVLRKGKP
ncbi:MAG TPA: S8 family serine peptidase [Streptosporangiaceae bacterium]|nr:S8 family serine peptidase [Streptosporangiaceae bacterium]